MSEKTIKVYIQGGCLVDVTNLPPDYDYELIDYDNQEAEANNSKESKEVKQ
jgi:hypothetical protein